MIDMDKVALSESNRIINKMNCQEVRFIDTSNLYIFGDGGKINKSRFIHICLEVEKIRIRPVRNYEEFHIFAENISKGDIVRCLVICKHKYPKDDKQVRYSDKKQYYQKMIHSLGVLLRAYIYFQYK